MRLSLSDPMPIVIDTRGGRPQQMRTALVTYREDVNINEIFWAMRSAKVKFFYLDEKFVKKY